MWVYIDSILIKYKLQFFLSREAKVKFIYIDFSKKYYLKEL